jgi:hypothetical protein
MKMPISEIIDRYTITLLKKERTSHDVEQEIEAYKREIDSYPDVDKFVNSLKAVNAKIWDLETEGGREDTEEPSNDTLIKMGKISISVRYWNRVRNGIKADIVDMFSEGFKEIKTNYSKTGYGWDSHKEEL